MASLSDAISRFETRNTTTQEVSGFRVEIRFSNLEVATACRRSVEENLLLPETYLGLNYSCINYELATVLDSAKKALLV